MMKAPAQRVPLTLPRDSPGTEQDDPERNQALVLSKQRHDGRRPGPQAASPSSPVPCPSVHPRGAGCGSPTGQLWTGSPTCISWA